MFKGILDKLTLFAETKLSVMKLSLIEKAAVIMAFSMLLMFAAFCMLIVLIILGIGLSYYFGELTGSVASGFFITAGIYTVLMVISLLLKKHLLKMFASLFINLMTDDIEHTLNR